MPPFSSSLLSIEERIAASLPSLKLPPEADSSRSSMSLEITATPPAPAPAPAPASAARLPTKVTSHPDPLTPPSRRSKAVAPIALGGDKTPLSQKNKQSDPSPVGTASASEPFTPTDDMLLLRLYPQYPGEFKRIGKMLTPARGKKEVKRRWKEL
ncbi:hypothetical protein JCM5296_000932 [Sporobolomyces johnsonii]